MDTSPPGQIRPSSQSQSGVIRRIRLACAHCRRRKTRCSGDQPSCQQCQAAGQSCVYKATTTAGKTTHHPQPPSAQWTFNTPTDELLQRLSSVEQVLSELTKNNSHTTGSTRQGVDETLGRSHPHSKSKSPRQLEIDSDLNFLDVPVSNSPIDEHIDDLIGNWDLQYETLPRHVVDSVIDLYFERVHGRPYAFFVKEHFKESHDCGTIPPFLVLSVLATAIRYSKASCFQGAHHQISDSFSSRAWQQILEQHLAQEDGLDLTVIQAVTLLAVVDYTAGRVSSGWLRLGLAVRLAQEADLMTGDQTPSSATITEQRCMTAWSIYMLDKLMSSSLSRPPAIEDSRYRMPLPGFDVTNAPNSKDQPTLQECLRSHAPTTFAGNPTSIAILSCSILGQCTKYISGHALQITVPSWHHESQFTATNSNLYLLESLLHDRAEQQKSQDSMFPKFSSPMETGQCVFAEAIFHLCHCLLNHPFMMRIMLQRVDSTPPRSFVLQSLQAAESHARSLTDLLTSTLDNSPRRDSSYFTYCLAIACGIHSLFRYANQQSEILDGHRSAYDYLQRSMTALYDLSDLWPMGSNMYAKLMEFEESSQSCSSLLSVDEFGERVDEAIQATMWPLIDHRCLAKGDSSKSSPAAVDMMYLSTPLSWQVGDIFHDPSVALDSLKAC